LRKQHEEITVLVMKACGESGRKAPMILKVSPRWMRVVSYMIWAL